MAIKRNEIKKEDRWNLELIFKNDEELNNDLTKLNEMLDILKGKVSTSLDSKELFKDYLLYDREVSILLEKIYVYASCKNDEDKSNSKYQELSGKMLNIYSKYSEITSSIEPRLLKLDDKKLKEYFNQEGLEAFDYYYKTLLDQKEHTLDENSEMLLERFMPVMSNNSETASLLMNADMKFGTIKDEDEKEVELTSSNYSKFMESDNRRVREEAFKKYHKVYGEFRNTLSSTYYQTVKLDEITSNLRKYKNSLDMYMSPSKLPEKLYTNLVDTVHSNLNVAYDYFELKRKMLNLDEFHLYDGYANVIPEVTKKYTFDEAKDIVIDALSILGEEYITNFKRAFTEGWIDKYPNEGKRSGAYSTGAYTTVPYVLLNFEGKYNDVSTLAHELGHSMHTYYSNTYNEYEKSGYPIFLAEIASTTNELLLSYYMFNNAKTKEEKLDIINSRLDNFKATIYRQTMFSEFELIAHKYVEEGNTLTADYLENEYLKLNKLYFGDKVVIDDEIKHEWSRIPHFYTPFYVYKYATSLSISYYIAKNIINEKEGFKEKYLEFLKSGGRDYPLEILKIIDIDLNNNKVFQDAINSFKEDIELFKKIYNEE